MKNTKIPVLLAALGAAIVILIIVVAVIDGIQHRGSTQGAPQTAALNTDKISPPADAKTGNRIGNLAPDFTLVTVDGKEIKLSDYRGKPVILNFWATWCGPCQYEIPHLKAVHQEWEKTGVTIIAISTQDTPDSAKSYVKTRELKFIVPLDPRGQGIRRRADGRANPRLTRQSNRTRQALAVARPAGGGEPRLVRADAGG